MKKTLEDLRKIALNPSNDWMRKDAEWIRDWAHRGASYSILYDGIAAWPRRYTRKQGDE